MSNLLERLPAGRPHSPWSAGATAGRGLASLSALAGALLAAGACAATSPRVAPPQVTPPRAAVASLAPSATPSRAEALVLDGPTKIEDPVHHDQVLTLGVGERRHLQLVFAAGGELNLRVVAEGGPVEMWSLMHPRSDVSRDDHNLMIHCPGITEDHVKLIAGREGTDFGMFVRLRKEPALVTIVFGNPGTAPATLRVSVDTNRRAMVLEQNV